MSQNKKKQTAQKQRASTASTETEKKSDEEQNSTVSETSPQTSTDSGDAGTPSGDTTEAGVDDPATDAPVSAPEGATTPEEPVADDGDDSTEGQSTENNEEAAPQVDGQTQGITTMSPDAIETPEEKAAQEPSVSHQRPVDANTEKQEWQGLSSPQAPYGRILEPDEEEVFDGEQVGNMVVLKEDVYRKFYPRGSRFPSYVKLHTKGTQVPSQGVQSK